MKLGDRIHQKRIALDLTLEEVASSVGVSRQTLSRYENSIITNIPSDKIELLASALETTPAYLMGWGDGITDLLSIPGIEQPPKWAKKPRLGTIACGEPILAQENVEGYDDVPEDVHCDFTLVCRGNSMIGARILDGDIVYIRQQEDVEDGEIAAVLIDESATLKRVYKMPGRVQLRAENTAYAPIDVLEGDGRLIRIIGKAVAFRSAVR